MVIFSLYEGALAYLVYEVRVMRSLVMWRKCMSSLLKVAMISPKGAALK